MPMPHIIPIFTSHWFVHATKDDIAIYVYVG